MVATITEGCCVMLAAAVGVLPDDGVQLGPKVASISSKARLASAVEDGFFERKHHLAATPRLVVVLEDHHQQVDGDDEAHLDGAHQSIERMLLVTFCCPLERPGVRG